jgi:phenol 2-monooxygenase
LADGKPMHLGHVQKADARWLLCAFAPKEDPLGKLRTVCAELEPRLRGLSPEGADIDAVIDTRAVLQGPHESLNITDMPPLLFPVKGRLGLRDYEKVFCSDRSRGDVFDMRIIDREAGCLVLVRPDQYVADVWPLDFADRFDAFTRRMFKGA